MTILRSTGKVPSKSPVCDRDLIMLNLYYGFWMTGAPKYRRYS